MLRCINKTITLHTYAVVPAALAAITLSPANADSSSHREAKFASGPFTVALIAASAALPLVADGKDGKNHAIRTADSLLTTSIATEVLKAVVREKRPRSNSRTSFPSGHTSAAFAAATMASCWHPRQAPLWYAGATVIGASRLQLHAHHVQDVIAGAALGYGISRLELKRPHGLLLTPFINTGSARVTQSDTIGLQLTKLF